MKKLFVAAMATVLCVLAITSCGEKRPCDFCGQEKKCSVKMVLGQEVAICEECTAQLSGTY